MSLAPAEPVEYSNHGLFTCLSCSIAFHSADDQREHYRSDHHRYNMKRRVAGLPPVSPDIFNQKVLERRAETAIMTSPKGSSCEGCGKVYTTEGAYRSHMASKKHKDNEAKAVQRALKPSIPPPEEPIVVDDALTEAPSSEPRAALETITEKVSSVTLTVDADASNDEIDRTIEEKIAAARSRLQPNQCLFCPESFTSLEANLTHMSSAHSFFIPDAEYLVDLTGLITYLGEKIAVGNVCIYCNGKGREFRTLDAVRKHMTDKGHCKLAYDSEVDRLELSDFYDFSSSYPEGAKRKKRTKKSGQVKVEEEADAEWEDMDEDDENEVDEVVEEEMSVDEDEDESDDDLPENQVTYGDSLYELVLPSGARIGHRSMKHYYAQSFRPIHTKPEDPNSGRALVRKLIGDKNSALVPVRGGFGAFGSGTKVVKARNRGEAREAGRHIREHRDQQRREQFKTKIGFIHNSQKHFRDPLLQPKAAFTLHIRHT
ncbi:hypothetical protein PHLGIDRAFT_118810 [Phlebiopsis gigantea 11061_1 CR5-6]|uniref:C2H2-type domain-containing protein n=1 Tax=Phlebiopsis gigantea (strain 11061_1 CR5-6) TaxID=745531 RepID=A0A0C3NNB9_PHLG1|nr:hypothetical protein PHLGIDRAFT_118810 [Phlebiopsis gigantea 11061_1 CR5-6]